MSYISPFLLTYSFSFFSTVSMYYVFVSYFHHSAAEQTSPDQWLTSQGFILVLVVYNLTDGGWPWQGYSVQVSWAQLLTAGLGSGLFHVSSFWNSG